MQNISQALCSGETISVGGQTFDETNPSGMVILPSASCDTFVFVNLEYHPNIVTDIINEVCIGEGLPNDTLYLNTFFGCDSTVYISYIEHPTSVTLIDTAIVEGQTFAFGNQILDSSGVYNLQLTNQFSCDSIVTLQLTVIVGTHAPAPAAIRIMPNPFRDQLRIEGEVSAGVPVQVKLYDARGSLLRQITTLPTGNILTVTLTDTATLPPGLYLLTVSTSDGRVMATERLIKG
jgi:hypothetical protein